MGREKDQGEGTPLPPGDVHCRTRSDLSLPKTADVVPLRGVAEMAATGSRRDLLVALRDKLWAAFHDERTQPRDLSPLTLRLKEITAEIEAIDLRDGGGQPPAEVEDGDFDEDAV